MSSPQNTGTQGGLPYVKRGGRESEGGREGEREREGGGSLLVSMPNINSSTFPTCLGTRQDQCPREIRQ